MCDTALGVTTQSKLTVQAPTMGSGVPAFGVGRFNGSLLICLRKYVALVSHCVPGSGRGTEAKGRFSCFLGLGRRMENGEMDRLGWTAHFMCIVCIQESGTVRALGCKSGTVLDLHRYRHD
ncbi:hypothetical protein [Desulfosporosinus metallidurans]|uniref:hypothetical protein n=1 Tax=Desulfosporosinus metallidurans TaxID=1888891 RepID=UPI00094C01F1|nr:hypothetical protein [Desulfosporosinus metallidurans]